MGEAYWNGRSPGSVKRPRTGFDALQSGFNSALETHKYLEKNDEWAKTHTLKDTTSLGSTYDKYLRNSQLPSEEGTRYSQTCSGKDVIGELPAFPMHNLLPARLPEAFGPELPTSGMSVNFGGPVSIDRVMRPQEILPLPPDASNTLYIEGLPSDCTKREVAHIFRPFVGYKEVRIVKKESKIRGGDRLLLSFVDFRDPACAATAMSALQGYKMDEHDPHSGRLRLQFSKFPGPRSASGPHGRQ